MKKVFKYSMTIQDVTIIELPKDAEILHVDHQENGNVKDFQLWALVDPNIEEKEKRIIRIAGTGHPIGRERRYINTFQMHNGALWFHAFELD